MVCSKHSDPEQAEDFFFHCHLLPLPYEAEGLSGEQLDAVVEWAREQQALDRPVLVVFDFDCTVTARHFFKSLYMLRDRYHADFLRWLPAKYFNNDQNKARIMDSLRFAPTARRLAGK